MARLSPGSGSISGSFWDTRAERYHRNVTLAHPDSDPFLRRLQRVSDASSSAIDAGAGTGRFALALAGSVRHVTAVDPSEAMLAVLARGAGEIGVRNLTTIQAKWEDADAEPAEIAFSSFVLALVPDAVAFIEKLEAAARRRVLLYLGSFSADSLLDPLWRHFHETPRAPGASYLDALAVLREMGIEPAVRVVEIPNRKRFATLAEAVEHYRDALLVEDMPEVRGELARLLPAWLMGRRGAYRSPLRATPAAIVEWTPRR